MNIINNLDFNNCLKFTLLLWRCVLAKIKCFCFSFSKCFYTILPKGYRQKLHWIIHTLMTWICRLFLPPKKWQWMDACELRHYNSLILNLTLSRTFYIKIVQIVHNNYHHFFTLCMHVSLDYLILTDVTFGNHSKTACLILGWHLSVYNYIYITFNICAENNFNCNSFLNSKKLVYFNGMISMRKHAMFKY